MHFIYFCAKEGVMSDNQIVTGIDVLYSTAVLGARIDYNFPHNIFRIYKMAGELTKEKFFPNKTIQHFGRILGKTKMFTFPKSDLS